MSRLLFAISPRTSNPTTTSPGVRPTDQINLTDADSRIMPATGKGFEQSYHAQAAVDTESMLVVATDMAQVATDKQQVEPTLQVLAGLPEALGSVKQLFANHMVECLQSNHLDMVVGRRVA